MAVCFAKHYRVVGFDINRAKIAELKQGRDPIGENGDEAVAASGIAFSHDPVVLRESAFLIICVPTPVDTAKRPDFGPLSSASTLVGKHMAPGAVVVYESTVYPGATEEVCVPILARESGLKDGEGFSFGYSPERINPGDKEHRLNTICKITSGSTPAAARFVDELYGSIVGAGTHKTSSIRVAEAAKVIENTQRDVNIALINELALIFKRLDLDTEEVLQAAGTKWNFLPFRPGLVGGHCIGVDPYYLTHKATEIGYHPEMILAGRRLNDNMGLHVANEVVRLMTAKRIHVKGAKVLVLGLTFKENCPDIRNSRVVDVVRELEKYGAQVDVYDPWIDAAEARHEYGIDPVRKLRSGRYDGAVVAVAHREFKAMGAAAVRRLCQSNHVLFDIKYVFAKRDVDGRL